MTINELKEQLEAGLETICEANSHKLKKDLTIGDLLKFKECLSAVNNILVVAQTCAFADEIGVPALKKHIENPNRNGFDIQYSNDDTKILAELKATVPCGKNSEYGANQKSSIFKDLMNLAGETPKSERLGIDLTKYKKHMVLFAIDDQKKAMSSLDKYAIEHDIDVKYINTNVQIDKYEAFGWKN